MNSVSQMKAKRGSNTKGHRRIARSTLIAALISDYRDNIYIFCYEFSITDLAPRCNEDFIRNGRIDYWLLAISMNASMFSNGTSPSTSCAGAKI